MKRLIKKSFFGPDAIKLGDIEFIEDNETKYIGRILVKLNEQGLAKRKEDPGEFKYANDIEPDVIAFVKWEVDDMENILEADGRGLNEDYAGAQVLCIPLMEVLPGYQQSMIFKYLFDKFNELVISRFQNEFGDDLYLDADFANSELADFIGRVSGSLNLKWLEDHIEEISEY